MSLYSQSFYGQPSYSASSYQQAPAHGGYQYQYQQSPSLPPAPTPQPIYQLDPVSFRREYTNRLAELQVNSRPIIQNLSMLAQEYSRFAEIVAQCLEAHIRRVSNHFVISAFQSFIPSVFYPEFWWLCGVVHNICCSAIMYIVLVLYIEHKVT